MQRELLRERDASPELRGETELTADSLSRTREAINLRLLLELRRRLKAAAERELALGADRMRALRTDLQRAESELRLCARWLDVRAREAARAAQRIEKTRADALKTAARLSSIEQEHADLAGQLAAAQEQAAQLQLSVRASLRARNGTLDSLLLATTALATDLSQATTDQSSLRARGWHLIEDSQSCAARAAALHSCLRAAHRSVEDLCRDIATGLDALPRRAAPSPPAAPPAGSGPAAPLPDPPGPANPEGER